MKPWLALTRLLGILAILGFVLAPFTVPAVAGGLSAAAIVRTDTVSPVGSVAMAEAPCCMPVQPSMPECPKGCPLAALCHAQILQGVPTVGAVVRWFSPAHALVPGDDATLDTLAQAPPARPPQV
jgi:hypothetical protein